MLTQHQTNRNYGTGQFQRLPPWQRPTNPNSMFSDEESCDKGRVIEVRWKDKNKVQAEELFYRLLTDLTSGAETARPSLYSVGQTYAVQMSGEVKVKVTMAYMVGTRWRYQLALVDHPGAVVQLFQTELIALRPAQLFYRGYEEQGAFDTEWPARETKDRITAA